MRRRCAAQQSEERWCDVCRKGFKDDRGLKIHEASAPHRAKQLAADTPAQTIQRNNAVTLEAQPAKGQRLSVTLDIQPDQHWFLVTIKWSRLATVQLRETVSTCLQ